MGRSIYDNGQKIELEDRALRHLHTVLTSKLRRGEPFSLSWKDDHSTGGGRTTVWIHADSNLIYRYHGSRQPEINRAWVNALAQIAIANSRSGLYLVQEPAASTSASAVRA